MKKIGGLSPKAGIAISCIANRATSSFTKLTKTNVPRFWLALLLILSVEAGLVPDVVAQQPRRLPVSGDTSRVHSANQIDNLVARVDSLERQLERHRYAESFLDTALEEQGNRFALIIGAILSLLGFLTYQGFRHEVRRLETVINSQKAELDSTLGAATARVENAELRLHITAGNVHRAIAELYSNRKGYIYAFQNAFIAAGHFCYVFTTASAQSGVNPASARKTCLANLRLALKHLAQLLEANQEPTIRAIRENRESFARGFGRLDAADDEDIRYLTAEIRVRLRDLERGSESSD